MKNKLLLSFLFLSFGAFAQEIKIGVRAGGVSASMRGDAVQSLNSTLDFAGERISTVSNNGLFAGAYASIPVSELFSIEPGLFYSQKGYVLKGDLGIKGAEFLGVNATASLNTQYVDVPVTLKANLNGFQVYLGPQISYLVDANLNTRAGALGFNVVNTNTDMTNNFNRWDAAAVGGVGYKFSNGLNISAGYEHGLSRVNSGQSLEAYNKAFRVGVGLEF